MFIDAPLGHTTGAPGDAEGQRSLLADGLAAAASIDEPGTIIDLDYRWKDDDWKADPLGWSRRRQRAGTTAQKAGDTRTNRSDEPQYQSEDDERLADAVSWDEQCLVCLGGQFGPDA